jgi:hypothetical protein
MLARAGDAFTDGRLTDETLRERLRAYLQGFATFIAR